MSAKHKRPFAVFAAVAMICGMVLFTGVHSKAEDSRSENLAGSSPTRADTLTQLPETQDPPTIGSSPNSGATGSEGGSSGTPETSEPGDSGIPLTEDESRGTGEGGDPAGVFGGIGELEPQGLGDEGTGEEESGPQDDGGKDGKGRGGRNKDGKNDKDDEGENGEGEGDEPEEDEPVEETEGLPEEPVDEGLPEDPADPEVTP